MQQKGSLVALAFDLSIRAQTGNRKSLDDVMRLLWQRYGRDFYNGKPRGIREEDVEALFAEATGADLRALFRDGVEQSELRTDLDAGVAALLFLSAANWAYTWLQSGRDTDELADRFFELLVDGMRGYATPPI